MPRTDPVFATSRSVLPRALLAILAFTGVGLGASTVAGAQQTGRATSAVVISTAKSPAIGTYLVSDRAVYTLKPSKVACTATCWKAWPPVLLPKGVTRATAGKGVKAGELGTAVVPGGARQVTYAGKALYWFYKDTAVGQVRGVLADKWGSWSTYVTAKAIRARSGSAPTTTVLGFGGTGGVAF